MALLAGWQPEGHRFEPVILHSKAFRDNELRKASFLVIMGAESRCYPRGILGSDPVVRPDMTQIGEEQKGVGAAATPFIVGGVDHRGGDPPGRDGLALAFSYFLCQESGFGGL